MALKLVFNPFVGNFDWIDKSSGGLTSQVLSIGFFTSFCCGDFSDFNINCFNEIDCGVFGNDTRQIIDLGVFE